MNVSCIVRGRTAAETRATASLYEGAARRVCASHLNAGILSGGHWESSELGALPDVTRQGRYLAAGMTVFTVFTDEALGETGGLTGPPPPLDTVFVPAAPVTQVDTIFQPTSQEQR